MMGAREVLASCAGWLMVSASRTTSCRVLASSNILSISLWTSAAQTRNIRLSKSPPFKKRKKKKNLWNFHTGISIAYLSSSECWISPLWVFCWGQISWLRTGRQLHGWLRFCGQSCKMQVNIHWNSFTEIKAWLSPTTYYIISPFYWPSLKSVFQEVKQSFLHHICHLWEHKKNNQLQTHYKLKG